MSRQDNTPGLISPARRDLLRLGALTGASGVFMLAAEVEGGVPNDKRKPDPNGDAQIINGAIQLEQKAVNTYQAAVEKNLVTTPAFREVALQFAMDHAQHRDRLMTVVQAELKARPASTANLGPFPIPEDTLKGGEPDALRYALTLELIAAKAYFDAVTQKLTTVAARDLAAAIMPVEAQHAAVFRSVLMIVLKDKGLPGDDKLVPYSFLSDQPTPPAPKG
jgi:rubrerythrin